MVDLGNATVPLNPQVMDDRPVWRILEMEIDVVRRLLFSLQTGAGDGQFLIGAPPLLAWRGVAYGLLQILELVVQGILLFENHLYRPYQ
jgi:hypothetical protein